MVKLHLTLSPPFALRLTLDCALRLQSGPFVQPFVTRQTAGCRGSSSPLPLEPMAAAQHLQSSHGRL